jgi:hypothetical protein
MDSLDDAEELARSSTGEKSSFFAERVKYREDLVLAKAQDLLSGVGLSKHAALEEIQAVAGRQNRPDRLHDDSRASTPGTIEGR